MVSHLEARLPGKHFTPNTLGETLKGPQRKFQEEALFVQYVEKKYYSSFGYLTDKIRPWKKKFLRSLIATSIKEGNYSDAWKFVAHHFTNVSSQIQPVYVYQVYSPMEHYDSLRISIAITDMNRLT